MNKLSLSLAAVAALLPLAVHAQQAPAAAGRTGTIDEFRACLNTQDEIEARQGPLRQRVGQLSKTAESLNAQAAELEEEAKRLTEGGATSGRRARHERKERAFQQEAEAHRVAQEAFNADRAKLESDFAAFREKCANVAYLQDDVEKVRKEREAAGKK